MIKDVLRMGDPLLLQVSEPVTAFGTPELIGLLLDMQDTMVALDGKGKLVTFEEEPQPGGRARFRIKTQPGAQISAPQIGSVLTAQLGEKLSAVSTASGETRSLSFGPEKEVSHVVRISPHSAPDELNKVFAILRAKRPGDPLAADERWST